MNPEELANKIAEETMKDGGRMAMQTSDPYKHTLILRTGEALEEQEPRTVYIAGVIETPFRWLDKRHLIIDEEKCHIVVDRDDMQIELTINEHDHYNDIIIGRLMISPEFKKFGINEGKYMTGLELSDLIRMNRSFFESKNKAMELVTIMRNFKATITKEVEANDDKKGNRLAFVRQVVEGNQPPSFELNIPIFKGQPKQKFAVEIDIDADTLQGTLVSPDAQDIIAETRDKLMDEVVTHIIDICPNIPIIEV